MNTVLVVAAAADPADDRLIAREARAASFVIAADGGGAACLRAGVRPDLVVGDMDSLDPEVLESLVVRGAKVETVPREKDATDLELALEHAAARSPEEIVIAGALGERVDHSLAALGAAAGVATSSPRFLSAREPAWVLSPEGRASIELPPATTFSVIALEGAARVTVSGAAWPLADHLLSPLSPLGVSNVSAEAGATVSVTEGIVLVSLPTDTTAPPNSTSE